uniref:Uncharacterized protein n=1 Tax=Globisporangium ultimum (strain ATCC 200006 / CBS 805.95 / DAOM BR144) TaxID=431595 RepID=K3X3C5_GLOUD
MVLTKSEKKVCISTFLAILSEADEAQPERVRSSGARKRFHYYVPFVGRLCKSTFLNCFEVSASTVSSYKTQIRSGLLISRALDNVAAE